MDDSNMDGDVVKALIFAEGGIRALLGGAFLATGYSNTGNGKPGMPNIPKCNFFHAT